METNLGYYGKVCVVTGSARGVGAALVKKLMEEGALVYALDILPTENVTKYIHVDLSKKKEIDVALKEIPDHVDALFSNAAAAGTSYVGRDFTIEEVFSINFLACRYLVDCIRTRMNKSGCIVVTSSTTGELWKSKIEILDELYEKYPAYEQGVEWASLHIHDKLIFNGYDRPDCLYSFCKEALIYYVKRSAFELLKDGIRINVLCPGGIDTPMTDEIARIVGSREWDKAATNPVIGRATSAEEQANCLMFLNSDFAACIVGADITSDFGFTPGVIFHQCTENGEFV